MQLTVLDISTCGMTLRLDGAVARVSTLLAFDEFSRLPEKVNGGETRNIDVSYVVVPVTLVGV